MPTAPPFPGITPPPQQRGLSPITVFVGSYLFGGNAALLLAAAIAVLIALPGFGGHTAAISAVAAAAVATAGLVAWLSTCDARGRTWARIATWAGCGLIGGSGLTALVLQPGSSLPWFTHLVQVGVALSLALVVASAVLLALPASNTYFGRRRPAPVAQLPTSYPPPRPSGPVDFNPFS